jgi:hypothetical protein
MSALDAELGHQQAAVGGMSGHRGRFLQTAAATVASPVIGEQAVVVGEDRLAQERLGPHDAHTPVDEHDGLPCPADLILELDPVQSHTAHRFSYTPFRCRCLRPKKAEGVMNTSLFIMTARPSPSSHRRYSAAAC